MPRGSPLPIFLHYIIHEYRKHAATADGQEVQPVRLPPLQQISEILESSVPNLREQLAVARALGLVKAKPKVGIYIQPYSFAPAVRLSLLVAVALDRRYFDQFADLRRELEKAYFPQAIRLLTAEDKARLQRLVEEAWAKLNENPPRIPHREHRDLHLTIYSRLENVFVQGLLEAFWDAYEVVGLNRYSDIGFLREVWDYHRRFVEAIIADDYPRAEQIFVEHINLLKRRQPQDPKERFSLWEE
ncbi:MAG: FadR family transcriptional regulator [Chloroflexi bacterium]|nr:FadR family transcriptional regulator [Chloroflexota bacterium]